MTVDGGSRGESLLYKYALHSVRAADPALRHCEWEEETTTLLWEKTSYGRSRKGGVAGASERDVVVNAVAEARRGRGSGWGRRMRGSEGAD